ncbi:MAG: hypothetical protein IH587_14545 [Anaerolineae bacterium]|nr:hypothetical protein [Anaerolineae bacterium]
MSNSSTNEGYEVIGTVKPFLAEWKSLSNHAHGVFNLQAEDEEDARLQAYHRLVARYEYERIKHDLPARSNAWQIDITEVSNDR